MSTTSILTTLTAIVRGYHTNHNTKVYDRKDCAQKSARVNKTALTSSVTMFFIYGNLNFVPGGYDPVRIIPPFPGMRLSISVYVSLPGTFKDPWHPLAPPSYLLRGNPPFLASG